MLALDLAALCREKFGEERAVACANLPYYITTPAITALLESRAFTRITVMVQREVAQRICAQPSTAAYSAFTIYVQYHAAAKILFDVPADCFVPRPKVDSAVLQLTPLEQPAVQTKDEKLFFALVRAAFNMRRKTLVNRAGCAGARGTAEPDGFCASGGCGGGSPERGMTNGQQSCICTIRL